MIGRAVRLALAPALVGAAVIAAGVKSAPAAPPIPVAASAWQPQPGDIILTAADDLVGTNIRQAAGGDAVYSHVGIVALRDGVPAVVEATPFGSGRVAFADLNAFAGDPKLHDVLVLRPRAAFDRARLSRAAAGLVAADIPFDFRFDMADAGAIYCAELAIILLRAAGIDMSGVGWTDAYVPFVGPQRLITPDALAASTTLQPIFRRRRG